MQFYRQLFLIIFRMKQDQNNFIRILPVKSLYQSARQSGRRPIAQSTVFQPISSKNEENLGTKAQRYSQYNDNFNDMDQQNTTNYVNKQQKNYVRVYNLMKNQQSSKKIMNLEDIIKNNIKNQQSHKKSKQPSLLTHHGYLQTHDLKQSFQLTKDNKNIPSLQGRTLYRTNFNDKKNPIKIIKTSRLSQMEKSEIFSSKNQALDQTWHLSKSQYKFPLTSKQNYNKDDTINELYRENDRKNSVIEELQQKINCLNNIQSGLKTKIHFNQVNLQLQSEKCKKLALSLQDSQQTVENLSQQLKKLNNVIIKQKEQHAKSQQKYQTDIKMLSLKIKQYELQFIQTQTYLDNLKDREKRTTDEHKRIINCLNELLRQKQEQILLIQQKQIENSLKNHNMTIEIQELKTKNEFQLKGKESLIRQLSQEISDLQTNLKNFQIRIKQRLQSQEELNSKMISLTQQSQKSQNYLKQLQTRLSVEETKRSQSERVHELIKLQMQVLTSLNKELSSKNLSLTEFIQQITVQKQKVTKTLSEYQYNFQLLAREGRLNEKIIINCQQVPSCEIIQNLIENQRESRYLKRAFHESQRRCFQLINLNTDLNETIVLKELQSMNNKYAQLLDQ